MDLAIEIRDNVARALAEDLGPVHAHGWSSREDITAQLVPAGETAVARVVSRQDAVLCGIPWFDACFGQLSSDIRIEWFARDGAVISPGQELCRITGEARALLTGERSALNFLQLLSAVATETARYVSAVAGTGAIIVDTRKTLPGLRLAQKYAVKCGGGTNHRLGLYDGVLIKENHVIAAGGIMQALRAVEKVASPGLFVQVEVETLDDLQAALRAGAKIILLDNFDLEGLRNAVNLNKQAAGAAAVLEASGGITLGNVRAVAETGVDRISIGSLTKDVKAVDLSMRFTSRTGRGDA
jgi:nicotinate-nucleotide pyrophosphorylase (carboxylating)